MKINFYDKSNREQKRLGLPLFRTQNSRKGNLAGGGKQDREGAKQHFYPVKPLSYQEPTVSEQQLRVYIEETAAEGNYAVAIALLDQLIALHPNSAIDYNNRGLMHLRNNQLAEALADLTHALEINPKLDSAYNNRANCYAAQGDLASAISDYDVALDLNPANVRAWINQGVTFREMGMYDLAIENFDIALILANGLQERIYAERGRAYHLRGDWNCAVADYQQALKLLSSETKLAGYRLKVSNWLNELLAPINL